jgi:type I restriction enzyme S subunit
MVNSRIKQNIPSGWQENKFLDCFNVSSKLAGIKQSEYEKEGEFPVFDQGQDYISGYSTNKDLVVKNVPAILFGDHTRIVKYIKNPFVAGADGTKIFWAKNNFDPKFLYYLVLNQKIPNTGYNRHFKFFKDIQVLHPESKTEQQKIAEILGTVDEDIAKTQEVIEATEKFKRGLMQQLFTRGIGHTKFKETKIGQIPEGWGVQRLERFIKSLDAGVSVNSTDAQKDSGEIGILKTSAVTFGVFDPNQHKVVVSEEVERVAVPVKADRLIVSRMNTRDLVGANAYTARSFPDLFLPDRLWQVEPNDEKDISMQWLSYVFNFQWKNGVFASLATGTSASMKNLSKGSIFNMELAFPKIKEQKEIAEILSTIDEKISVNKKLKEKLTLLKKGLMQDLLSGKVRTV